MPKKKLPFEEIERRLDAFDSMLIKHPRLDETKDRMDMLVMQTRSRILQHDRKIEAANGRPIKSAELWVQPLVGPSGSGKSTSLSTYVDGTYADPKVGTEDIPALIVTMRSSTRTPRQLQAQILEAYGDPSASAVLVERDYSEALVNESIRKIARLRNTHLVVIDEASNAPQGVANQLLMAKAIKSLVNDGLFSVVLSGTDQLNGLINCDRELMSRLKEPIDFGRLRQNEGDLQYFMTFVRDLENRIVELKIMDNPIGLAGDVQACGAAYDMSEGVIGIVVRVLRIALERTFMQGMTVLEWDTIATSFQAWRNAEGEGLRIYDPFHSGVRARTSELISKIGGVAE